MIKKKKIILSIISVVLVLTLLFGIVYFFAFKDNKEKESFAGATVEEKNTNAVISLTDGASFTLSGGAIVSDSGDSSVQGNTHGGAVYVGNGSTFKMSGGIISNFTASNGGAIYIASGGTCIITGGAIQNSFEEGTKSASFGGAIYVANGGTLKISDMSIRNCLAFYENGGNAIYAEDGASVQFGDIVNGSFSTDRSYSRKNAISRDGKGLLIEGCKEEEGQQFYFAEAETNLQNGNLINIPVFADINIINRIGDESLNNVHISDTSAFLSLENCCGYFKDEKLTIVSNDAEFDRLVESNTFRVKDQYTAEVTEAMKQNLVFNFVYPYSSPRYCIVRCNTTAVGEVVLPAEQRGMPVKQIYFKSYVSVSPSQEAYEGYYNNIETGFKDCVGITKVYMPATITNIPNYAFFNCTNLNYINIHDNLSSISDWSANSKYGFAFRNCTSLRSFYVNNIEQITWGAFEGSGVDTFIYKDGTELDVLVLGEELIAGTRRTRVIPDDVRIISPYAFKLRFREFEKDARGNAILDADGHVQYGEQELVSLDCSNVEEILTGSFMGCYNLNGITVRDLKFLGSGAFTRTALTEFTLPDNIEIIGSHIFRYCENLKKVNWGRNKTVPTVVFENCIALEEFTIELPPVISGSNDENYISEDAFVNCPSLKRVNIFNDMANAYFNAFTKSKTKRSSEICFYVSDYFNKAEIVDAGDIVYCGVYDFDLLPSYDSNNGKHYFYGFSYEEYQASFDINKNNIDKYAVKVNPSNTNECELIYYTGENLAVFSNGYSSGEYIINKIITKVTLNRNKFVKIASIYCDFYPSSFKYCSSLTELTLPNEELTIINESMFYGCSSLKYLSARSIETIGDSAFYGCASLSKINSSTEGSCYFPNVTDVGRNAFFECVALKEIDLQGATNIDTTAFSGCSNLKKLNLESLESISAEMFNGLSNNLESVHIQGVKSIPENTFTNFISLKFVLLLNVEEIGASAFKGCSQLTTVFWMNNVKTIGLSAFNGCSSLTSISLPVAESIGNSAFCNCSSLEGINSDTITTIGDYAFQNCSVLETVELKNVQKIGICAFECDYNAMDNGCANLKSIYIPNVVTIGWGAFKHQNNLKLVSYCDEDNILNTSTTLNLPELTSVGAWAFAYTNFNTVSFKNVKTIEEYTFYNCSLLGDIYFANVTEIKEAAFMCDSVDDANLSSIYMPDVEIIGNSAFKNQKWLAMVWLSSSDTTLSLKLDKLITLGEEAFKNTGFLAIDLATIESISRNAFANCLSLKKIKLSSAKTIGFGAFQNCTTLNTIDTQNVTTIDSYAFAGCVNLQGTEKYDGIENAKLILKSVKQIDHCAFDNCTKIKYIEMHEDGTAAGMLSSTHTINTNEDD